MKDEARRRKLIRTEPVLIHDVLRQSDFQTFSGYRLTKSIRPMYFVKALGSTIALGVRCLVHDVNIRSLTLQFG